MKKINSIEFGGKAVVLTVALLALIPAACQIAVGILQLPVFYWIRNVSLALGGISLVALLLIGCIEFKQDRYMNNYYLANINVKNKLEGNRYECQNCGYNQLIKTDKLCPVCGTGFKEDQGENGRPSKWFLQ